MNKHYPRIASTEGKSKRAEKKKRSLQESSMQSPNSKRGVLPVTPWNISIVGIGSGAVTGNTSPAKIPLSRSESGPPPGLSRYTHNMSRSSWNPPPGVTRDISYGRSLRGQRFAGVPIFVVFSIRQETKFFQVGLMKDSNCGNAWAKATNSKL